MAYAQRVDSQLHKANSSGPDSPAPLRVFGPRPSRACVAGLLSLYVRQTRILGGNDCPRVLAYGALAALDSAAVRSPYLLSPTTRRTLRMTKTRKGETTERERKLDLADAYARRRVVNGGCAPRPRKNRELAAASGAGLTFGRGHVCEQAQRHSRAPARQG